MIVLTRPRARSINLNSSIHPAPEAISDLIFEARAKAWAVYERKRRSLSVHRGSGTVARAAHGQPWRIASATA